MQSGNVTTPFGRRLISLALVRGQMRTAEIKSGKSVDKWKVFRDACEARAVLGAAILRSMGGDDRSPDD
ncbi:hypothetical protein ASD63_31250 [Ensifer sp. Root558]|nr:hypothetical protein ASD63_31250 [Ensifer sp. Root558]